MEETFGQRLKRLRQQLGIRQGQFAADVGLRQSLISMLEDGDRHGDKIKAGNLYRMAHRLGVTMEYLLTGETRKLAKRQRHPAGVAGAGEDMA